MVKKLPGVEKKVEQIFRVKNGTGKWVVEVVLSQVKGVGC